MAEKKKSSISGFTIVRNAQLLDYPFKESVRSVLPLCDEFIINCGDSSDDTERICEDLEKESKGKIKLVSSVWDQQDQKGGFQLKAQTDTTMAYCRERWCFYIQADEVIHEADYEKIRQSVKRANQDDTIDGVLFEYKHFYGSYDYTIHARNWYRHEVRLFKNHRGVSAFRDAQGFRIDKKRLKVIASAARVFHYGYVRSAQSLKQKTQEMSLWWGEKAPNDIERFRLKKRVGVRAFNEAHPQVMAQRVRSAKAIPFRLGERVWDRKEFKNLLSALWEAVFRFRIGEFKNYLVVNR